jgi:hypothetical protein
LAACGSSNIKPSEANNPMDVGPKGSMITGDESGSGANLTFGISKKQSPGSAGAGNGMVVNAYLWRGALDTLSFLPLTSVDPFGGVIITDWYSPAETQGERFKATAYILGRELRADAVRVAVYHQVLKAGQWQDVPVTQATQTELEDKVLTRARELRAQAAAAN